MCAAFDITPVIISSEVSVSLWQPDLCPHYDADGQSAGRSAVRGMFVCLWGMFVCSRGGDLARLVSCDKISSGHHESAGLLGRPH